MTNTDKGAVVNRCFACGRVLPKNFNTADTRDGQVVWVGPDCMAKIKAAGETGYQPSGGCPRLYEVRND